MNQDIPFKILAKQNHKKNLLTICLNEGNIKAKKKICKADQLINFLWWESKKICQFF